MKMLLRGGGCVSVIAIAAVIGCRSRGQAPTAAGQASSPAQTYVRPTPPTRDPHTAGYVKATELPDGDVPPADKDGNFLIGPTHVPAPGRQVSDPKGELRGRVVEITMSSADSKFYPGIARDKGTFGTPDPKDPAKLVVTTSRP